MRPEHDKDSSNNSTTNNNIANANLNHDPDHLNSRPHAPRLLIRRRGVTPMSTTTCTVQAVDIYTAHASFTSPYTLPVHQPRRAAAPRSVSSKDVRSRSDAPRSKLKRRTVESRDGATMSAPPTARGIEPDHNLHPAAHTQWMKRLSSISTPAPSLQSSPGPDSTTVSRTNDSFTFSTASSTSPIFPPQPNTTALPPNKLVKRSSSLHNPSGYQSSNTRIPKPVLRRPATSHQRHATLQEHRSRANTAVDHSRAFEPAPIPAGPRWRSFFTPRVLSEPLPTSRRRNSTGIPNPIKRVYPDRRYHPTLVSAGEPIAPATLEFEAGHDESDSTTGSRRWFPDSRSSRFFTSPHPPPRNPHVAPQKLDLTAGNLVQGRPAQDFTVKGAHLNPSDISAPETGSRHSASVDGWSAGESQVRKRPLSGATVRRFRWSGRTASGAWSNTSNRHSAATDDFEFSLSPQDPASFAQPSKFTPASSTLQTDLVNSSSFQQWNPVDQYPQRSADPHSTPGQQNAFGVDDLLSNHPSSSPSTLPPQANADDIRSTPHAETNLKPDSAFDSVLLRGGRTSPARRGPAIETIFQDSPPSSVGSHTLLKDILHQSPHQSSGQGLRPRHSVIDEEEFLATPVRSARHISATPLSNRRPSASPASDMIPSSPLALPSLLELRHNDRFVDSDDDLESSWSFGGDMEKEAEAPGTNGRFAHIGIASDVLMDNATETPSPTLSTPQRAGSKQADRDYKNNIFDWSEQQVFDRSPGRHTPPRPKTVHGKKDADSRGSRSVGRRIPSGLHARSQSVPVAQETEGKRSNVVTNKFGTWGVGSKGVTEDWNEDFDFGDGMLTTNPGVDKRLDSGLGMIVPKSIREQQNNVLANIGLLRDWGLLIEELKELRVRASALEVPRSLGATTWDEVDAMIDLADQESNEHTLAPRYSRPSSPSFNYEAFEEKPLTAPPIQDTPYHEARTSDRDNVTTNRPASPICVEHEIRVIPPTPRRLRKDSEAVARSVIEALQQKRLVPESGLTSADKPEKVHFDTATLRRIIPHVQELRDNMKAIIREAEGLVSSPTHRDCYEGDLSFSTIFQDSGDSPSNRSERYRVTNPTNSVTADDGHQSPNEDLAARLRIMTVV